jgi:membrane protein
MSPTVSNVHPWNLANETALAFVEDEASYRTRSPRHARAVTSIAPLLLIVVAIAGLVFGQEAA